MSVREWVVRGLGRQPARERAPNCFKNGVHLRFLIWASVLLVCVNQSYVSAHGQSRATLVAYWQLNDGHGNSSLDSVSGRRDRIQGNFSWVRGIDGSALQFDGFTTLLERDAKDAPPLHGSFSIDAWVALESYPWSWLALMEQRNEENAGFSFGLDQDGHIGLQVGVWGRWEEALSPATIPLKRWTHLSAVYDARSGISLYINGQPAGGLSLQGKFEQANEEPVSIGRNHVALPATALVRPRASLPALYSLDGILSELKLYDGARSPYEVRKDFTVLHPTASPQFPERHWPDLREAKSTRLQAAYTLLKLYPQWDSLWRTGPATDVVVSFPNLPFHYVFWRGSNYGECLVTENGTWIGDQSFESSTKLGTAEHMNDKHDMWSHISVLESGDSRVVLHWRYALVDIAGDLSDVDPVTGWGNWADEYFYIYPDGVSVRNGTIHGTKWKYGFTEPTLLLEPGQKPEDLISLQAATIENEHGRSKTYSWDPVPPAYPFPDQPEGANIAVLNTKSKYKPFYVYMPGVKLGPYGWPPEERPLYSHFPVWDHWPVNQIPSDGRFALHADHFASSAVLSPNTNGTWIEGPGPTKTAYFLFGLTNKSPEQLAALDRSWLHPPAVQISHSNATIHYDPGQRAYVIAAAQPAVDYRDMTLSIEASEESPLANAAFVLGEWGSARADISIDGHPPHGGEVLTSRNPRLEGDDLIVWVVRESAQPVTIRIRRVAKTSDR